VEKKNPRMGRVLILFTLLICNSVLSQVTVAVLDFENNSIMGREKWAPLTSGLAQILTSEIDPVAALKVVERRRLKDLMDEVKLAQSGMIDDRQTVSVGKLVGARYMIFGAYLVDMKEKIRIDMRIVDVETGEALKAGQQTGKARDFLKLMLKLTKSILKDIEIPLTREDDQRFKSGQSHPVGALLAYAKGVKHEDNRELREAVLCYREALKIDPDFEAATVQLNAMRKRLQKNR